MAKTASNNTSRRSKNSSTPQAGNTPVSKVETRSGRPNPASQPKTPQREAVAAQFRAEAGIRQALTENFKPLHAEAQAMAARVEKAFAKFNPSTLSAAELERRHHVAPGTDPGKALESVIERGVHALRSANTKRGLTLRNSAELKRLVKKKADSPSGTVELGALFELIRHLGAGQVTRPEPTTTPYQAEAQAEAILNAVGNTGGAAVANQQEDRAAEDGGADVLVRNNVNLQMNSATAPEGELVFGKIPNNADEDKAQKTILKSFFQLREGPTDVTSYHDFHTLQIAFQHVWTEIFDGQLTALGRDLYREYVRLKDFTGSSAPDLEVGTYADLKRLIEEVKQLSQFVDNELPASFRPPGGEQTNTGGSTLTPEDVGRGVGAVLSGGLTEVALWVLKAISDAGKKPILNWSHVDSRGRPLPNGYGTIIATFKKNAPSGYVQMRLETAAGSHLKIMEFQPWDPSRGMFINHMNGNDLNNLVSNAGHLESYTTPWIERPASTVGSGVIEFASEQVPGVNQGRYVLAGLQEKLWDGWSVTFAWTD